MPTKQLRYNRLIEEALAGKVGYNDELHRYTIDGRVVPGVTTVCYANSDDFLFRSEGLNAAASFGTNVHKLLEEHTLGTKKKYDEGERELADAWDAWLDANDFEVVGCEVLLASLKRKVCGRCDLIMKKRRTGKIWVGDWKTGQVSPQAALQMEAYAAMIEELIGETVEGTVVAQLSHKGERTDKARTWRRVPAKGSLSTVMDRTVFFSKLISLQWDVVNAGKKL